jgi:K+-sensing histidine kinase KdpD
MYSTAVKTYFDRPERISVDEIENLRTRISNHLPCIQQILEAFPHIALILDEHRQIIAFNSKAVDYFFGANETDILGRRLGEALNCIHSNEMEAGCGTSVFCRECGAAQSIKKTNETNENVVSECRITVKKLNVETSLDFRVHTSKIFIDGLSFTLFAVEDIQSEKRKLVLERVFFHDVLNTASSIKGIAEVLPQIKDSDEYDEFVRMLQYSSDQLIDEIQAQRDLTYAESGILKCNFSEVSVNEILSRVEALYKNHEVSKGKFLEIRFLQNDIKIKTDATLLIRSLGNLLKNALEAITANKRVKVYSETDEDEVKFIVCNEGVIPESVQLQIFQRSFSTKANFGRGIGTYSVKLFVEKYLGGKVSFISDQINQTQFFIILPRK